MFYGLRLLHAGICLATGIVLIVLVLEPARLFPARGSRSIRSFTMTVWARWMLKALGLRRRVEGEAPKGKKLYVANHISWVDILVLMATQKGVFVAKSEISGWPLIGWMCKRTGTLFLRRGSARALGEKIVSISNRLLDDESVFCFPEGTTTAGESVRSFYPGLFQAAIDADVSVQPVALAYFENGVPSKSIPFIDCDDFFSHFNRLLKTNTITAHVNFLPDVDSVLKDRREIASAAHESISAKIDLLNTFQIQSAA